jgi:hypothetical protein
MNRQAWISGLLPGEHTDEAGSRSSPVGGLLFLLVELDVEVGEELLQLPGTSIAQDLYLMLKNLRLDINRAGIYAQSKVLLIPP